MNCSNCKIFNIHTCEKYKFCEPEMQEHDNEIWNEAIDKFLESLSKNKTKSKEKPNIIYFDVYRLRKIAEELKK